jgi:hypothetical protein
MGTRHGQEFVATDIEPQPALGGALVATYSTAIRAEGRADGQTLGVLAIFFDWEAQSRAVVQGVKFTPEERSRARAMLVDGQMRVIASSDGEGVLEETLNLKPRGKAMGFGTSERGVLTGFARTPGYETYAGMGWHGVITLQPAVRKAGAASDVVADAHDDDAGESGTSPDDGQGVRSEPRADASAGRVSPSWGKALPAGAVLRA